MMPGIPTTPSPKPEGLSAADLQNQHKGSGFAPNKKPPAPGSFEQLNNTQATPLDMTRNHSFSDEEDKDLASMRGSPLSSMSPFLGGINPLEAESN